MPITAIGRYFVGNPDTVSIVTTDNLAAITTAGYLVSQSPVIEALNNGEFQWADTDIVLMYYSPTAIGYFTRDAVNNTFVALSSGGGGAVVLPTVANTLASFLDTDGTIGNADPGIVQTLDTDEFHVTGAIYADNGEIVSYTGSMVSGSQAVELPASDTAQLLQARWGWEGATPDPFGVEYHILSFAGHQFQNNLQTTMQILVQNSDMFPDGGSDLANTFYYQVPYVLPQNSGANRMVSLLANPMPYPDPSANVLLNVGAEADFTQLATGGEPVIFTSPSVDSSPDGDTYMIMDMWINSSTSVNFTTGDRDIEICDITGTTVYSTIPSATLLALDNYRWGDTEFPAPASGVDYGTPFVMTNWEGLIARYAGGASDYDAGVLSLNMMLVKVSNGGI